MAAVTRDADGLSCADNVEAVLGLLRKALQLLDEIGDHPVIGARIQGLIDDLANESSI